MNHIPDYFPENSGPNFVIPSRWDLSSVSKNYLNDLIDHVDTIHITSQSDNHISYEKPRLVKGEIDSFDLIFNQVGHLVATRDRLGGDSVYISVIAGDIKNRLTVRGEDAGYINPVFESAQTSNDVNQVIYQNRIPTVIGLSGGVIRYPSAFGASLERPVTFDFKPEALLAGEDIVETLIEFDMGSDGWEITSHGKSADFRWAAGDIDARISYQVQNGRIIVGILDKKTGLIKTLDCPVVVDAERVAEIAFAANPTEPERRLYPAWRTDIGKATGVNFMISKEIDQENQSE